MSQPNELETELSLQGFHPGPKPPWRNVGREGRQERDSTQGYKYHVTREQVDAAKAALILRRPLLITGKPGTGKSSLAYWVAAQMDLGSVLRWQITSRSSREEGLYQYDALGRLQDARAANGPVIGSGKDLGIGAYIRLGPLGTALVGDECKPRVLVIDELDKSSIDLPSDLLHVFEEGEFEIPEISRLNLDNDVEVGTADRRRTLVGSDGWVGSGEFPFIVITSNAEREFPGPFLRRCIRLRIEPPKGPELMTIARQHFHGHTLAPSDQQLADGIGDFLKARDVEGKELAIDQLLNAILLRIGGGLSPDVQRKLTLQSLREGDS